MVGKDTKYKQSWNLFSINKRFVRISSQTNLQNQWPSVCLTITRSVTNWIILY